MPLVTKSQIIVIHLTKYGDSGAIVHVIDSLSGRQSLYLRGIKKSKNNAVLPYFHNLNILNVVTASSPKSSLLYLREYSPLYNLNDLRSDVYKRTIAIFISEIIYRSIKVDDGDSALFVWLSDTIILLNDYTGSISNFHLRFLVDYSSKMGFRPNDNYTPDSPLFDMVSAQFVPSGKYHNIQQSLFTAEDSLLLHKLLSTSLEESLLLPLSSSRRLSFAQSMINFLAYHFGIDLKIQSLKVLHEIFI